MENQVRNFLKKYNIKGENALVAYSTGVDSTCLLNILNNLKKEFSLNLTAIHLNHGWRGVQSDADEVFARDFCREKDINFYSEKLNDDVEKNETAARDARYDFFEKSAKKFGSKYVFLAHNKEDNVETLIYRIAKGTGIEGLRSILSNRDIFYRPFLDISKDDIKKYAKKNNLKFRQDSSNTDIKYKRNFIRHKVLPLLQEINPTCICSINNLIKVATSEYEIIEDKLNEVKENIFENDKIKTQEFLKLKPSYQLKMIQNYLKDDLKNPNLKKIESVVNFIRETNSEIQDPQFRKWKKFSVNSKIFLYVNKKEIFKGE